MKLKEEQVDILLRKWQDILRLRDWDIKPVIVTQEWRKSGDVKIDRDNHMAAVMIHETVPEEHLEEVVVHELLHLRLYGMDQLIEETINILHGPDDSDPKKQLAIGIFFLELESTVEDLTKAMLTAYCNKTDFWFKRVDKQIREELE